MIINNKYINILIINSTDKHNKSILFINLFNIIHQIINKFNDNINTFYDNQCL